jgi:hypothetical protein
MGLGRWHFLDDFEMTPDQIYQAGLALDTLKDIQKAVFSPASYGDPKTELKFSFGGRNNRILNSEQAAVVLKALCDHAEQTLVALGVDLVEGIST